MKKRIVVERNKIGEFVANLYFDNMLTEGTNSYKDVVSANKEATNMAKLVGVKEVYLG